MQKFKPIAWHLPRPSKSKYKGSVPLHLETKFLKLTGLTDSKRLLQMFSGGSKMGYTVDCKGTNNPDKVADCHSLPFEDNSFDNTFLDPPYSDDESKQLYGTGPLKPSKYISEAVRVTKPDGLIAVYHVYLVPRPLGCHYLGVITIVTRVYHKARILTIFRKDNPDSVYPRDD